MAQKIEKENTASIQGLLYKCKTNRTTMTARLEVATAKENKNADGSLSFKDWLYHKAAITEVDKETFEKLEKAEKVCNNNMANFGKPDFVLTRLPVAFSGTLDTDESGCVISVKGEAVAFPKKLKMTNAFNLKGEVMQTVYNDAYATATIKIKSDENKDIYIPLCVYSKDNPQKWASISRGDIKKGSILSTNGPLIGKTFQNGNSKIYRYSVNARDFKILNRKKTEKETHTLGF